MIAPRNLLFVAALVFTAQADLFAQQEPPVAPGDRVRVTAPTEVSSRFVGTVMEIGADTCVLEVDGRADPMTLPLASVTSLEVSQGKKSHVLLGAGIGLVAGGLIGMVVGASPCEQGETCPQGLFGGFFGALGGLALGSILGAAAKTDRWEVVDLQSVRVSLTPYGRRGLAVSASIRF